MTSPLPAVHLRVPGVDPRRKLACGLTYRSPGDTGYGQYPVTCKNCLRSRAAQYFRAFDNLHLLYAEPDCEIPRESVKAWEADARKIFRAYETGAPIPFTHGTIETTPEAQIRAPRRFSGSDHPNPRRTPADDAHGPFPAVSGHAA